MAVLSVAAASTGGWNKFVGAVVWEVIVGMVVAWLCRGCHYGVLWVCLILFSGLPLALTLIALLMVGSKK